MGKAGIVRIKAPKTSTSARTLVIPGFALGALRRTRIERVEAAFAKGEKLDLATPVCLRTNGSVWKPHDLSREFARALTKANLPHVSYHGLRHIYATLTLQSGTDLKHVSHALGHSGVGITGRVYAHVIEAVQEEAATRLDNLLGRPIVGDCAQNVPNSGSAG